MVRTPSSLRTGATFFIAGWWLGGEHKANAHIADAMGDLLGLQIDIHAQRFHRIGAAGFAAHAAPAVLAHFAARSGNHKGGTGGDIEGVGAIAAGANDIDQMGLVLHVDLVGKLAHHLRCGRDFTNGFLLHAQAGDDGRRHHGRQLAAHDHAHQVQHFVVEDFAVFDRALQRFFGGVMLQICGVVGIRTSLFSGAASADLASFSRCFSA